MTTTPPLPATVIINTPQRVTFQITNPSSPLFLRTLHTTASAPSANGSVGSVSPGTAGAPATHSFNMGGKFATIRTFLQNNPGSVALLITYDPISFAAFDLDLTSLPAVGIAANP